MKEAQREPKRGAAWPEGSAVQGRLAEGQGHAGGSQALAAKIGCMCVSKEAQRAGRGVQQGWETCTEGPGLGLSGQRQREEKKYVMAPWPGPQRQTEACSGRCAERHEVG